MSLFGNRIEGVKGYNNAMGSNINAIQKPSGMMNIASSAGRNFKSLSTSKFAGGLSKLARVPGKIALNPIGGYAIMGAVGAAMTYDPMQRHVMSHTAQEGIKTASDLAFDTAVFGVGTTLLGPLWGAGAAMATIVGAHLGGVSPGQTVGKIMDAAGESYKKKVMRQPTPIKQNERTAGAMRKSLSLLGQTGRKHSMLGSEAQYMHN